MDKKIFFTDLDATLLDDEKNIPQGSREALESILERGHAVAFTTGRVLESTAKLVRRVGFYRPGCYLICYNGGQVYDIAAEESLYLKTVPMDLVALSFRMAREDQIHIQTYGGSGGGLVLAEKASPYLDDYCRIQVLEQRIVEDAAAALEAAPPKMLAIEPDQEKMKRFRQRVGAAAGSRMDLFMSSNTYMELVPPGVNKGDAVRFLCERLQVPTEHAVAAGDAENDISMLQAAGTGAAMANARDSVKDMADFVTTRDNNHSGVAEILERFF